MERAFIIFFSLCNQSGHVKMTGIFKNPEVLENKENDLNQVIKLYRACCGNCNNENLSNKKSSQFFFENRNICTKKFTGKNALLESDLIVVNKYLKRAYFLALIVVFRSNNAFLVGL